jgi:peroxiredoxin
MKKCGLIAFLTMCSVIGSAQQYLIKGNITGFPDGSPFLLKDLDVDEVIDSAVMKDHTFTLKGRFPDPPASLWLYSVYNNNFYYVILLIGNDTITVNGDIKDLPFDIAVTGSHTQDEKNALNALTKEQYKSRAILMSSYFSVQGDSAETAQSAILNKINVLDSLNLAVRKKFIDDHQDTYIGMQEMFFLRNQLGRDTLHALYASLPPFLRESRFGARISNFLKIGEPVKAGDGMADFTAYDRDGKSRRPSEYKGRYVLLDFSTTYCGPCMQSVADMRKLTAQYADRLQIISLSGDEGKKTWLTGMDRDQPNWLSLWDGKGIYGEAMLKYGVTGFPTFCLVDPQGKIVSLWSGYGKEKDGSGSLESAIVKAIGK